MINANEIDNRLNNMKLELNKLIIDSYKLIEEIDKFKDINNKNDMICYLRGKGLSYAQIADHLGVSTMTVYNRAKKMGLD